jgi:hypothetical protein
MTQGERQHQQNNLNWRSPDTRQIYRTEYGGRIYEARMYAEAAEMGEWAQHYADLLRAVTLDDLEQEARQLARYKLDCPTNMAEPEKAQRIRKLRALYIQRKKDLTATEGAAAAD